MASKYIIKNLPIKSMAQANKLTIHLYTTIQKNVPNLIAMYDLSYTPEEVRKRVKELFKKNYDVTDYRVSQLLLVRGAAIYDEFQQRFAPTDAFISIMNPIEKNLGYEVTGDKEQDFLTQFKLGIEDTNNLYH